MACATSRSAFDDRYVPIDIDSTPAMALMAAAITITRFESWAPDHARDEGHVLDHAILHTEDDLADRGGGRRASSQYRWDQSTCHGCIVHCCERCRRAERQALLGNQQQVLHAARRISHVCGVPMGTATQQERPMRHRRFVTLAAMALAFVLAGSAVAAADPGGSRDQAPQATEQNQERAGDRTQAQERVQIAEPARDRVRLQDGDAAPAVDPVQDRDRMRAQDGAADDPVRDRDRVQAQDRPTDLDIDRPTLRRCVNWLLENTDVNYGDNVRRWLWACHRLLAHFNQPL